MKYTIEEMNNITKLIIDFSDEGISLQGETTVKGGKENAEKYIKIFANDLKRNNIELFPKTEPEYYEEGEMMI